MSNVSLIPSRLADTQQPGTITRASLNNEPVAAAFILSPGYGSLLVCLLLAVALVAFYFVLIRPFVFLPADILAWAETSFVGDIIKLQTGVPLYTSPSDSNSVIYTPAAQLLTYAISWVLGKTTSLPAMRMIQLGFVFCAAMVATACCRKIRNLAYPNEEIAFPKTWLALTFLALFLAATAPNSNRLVHVLHADALALLMSMVCFWSILRHLEAPSLARLILMAVCPALGYLTKQFLLAWLGVMFVFLLLQNPRGIRRLIIFTLAGVGFAAVAMGVCYLLWGDNYVFWTFKVVGGERSKMSFSPDGYHISLLRSLDHTLKAWMQIAIGVVGGLLILREWNIRKLGPLWVAWIVLVAVEATSSGVGWNVLYHFGPGVLIGMTWMFAGLPRLWPSVSSRAELGLPHLLYWIRPLIAAACVVTIFIALQVVPLADQGRRRYGQRPSADVYRYISDIEREFDGLPPEKVLLDIGNWIYLRHSVLAKDRAVPLGDQPPNGIYENFDAMVSRIRSGAYSKILVHDLNSPRFLYDWAGWPKSSGVKDALLEHYTEVRTIPGPEGEADFGSMIAYTGPVSVLIPKFELPGQSSTD